MTGNYLMSCGGLFTACRLPPPPPPSPAAPSRDAHWATQSLREQSQALTGPLGPRRFSPLSRALFWHRGHSLGPLSHAAVKCETGSAVSQAAVPSSWASESLPWSARDKRSPRRVDTATQCQPSLRYHTPPLLSRSPGPLQQSGSGPPACPRGQPPAVLHTSHLAAPLSSSGRSGQLLPNLRDQETEAPTVSGRAPDKTVGEGNSLDSPCCP